MKRTTIFIPEALEADLQRYARRARKPAAWVVREAVATFLSTHAAAGALPSSIGLGRSGRGDVSERFEELLFADRAAARAKRAHRRSPRRQRAARRVK